MDKRTDAQIFIYAHKIPEYGVPNNSLVTPIQVGTEYTKQDLFEYKDNTLDNMGIWNPLMIENTGLYWLYKNITSKPDCPYKYIGQMQYRRLLPFAEDTDFDQLFENHNAICIASPTFMNISIRQQYINAHSISDLDLMLSIVRELYPNYAKYIDTALNGSVLLYSCGLIAKKEDFNEYADFIITLNKEFIKRRGFKTVKDVEILITSREADLKSRTNVKNMNPDLSYQMGILGFINERLMTLFWVAKSIETNKRVVSVNYEVKDNNKSNYIYKKDE